MCTHQKRKEEEIKVNRKKVQINIRKTSINFYMDKMHVKQHLFKATKKKQKKNEANKQAKNII